MKKHCLTALAAVLFLAGGPVKASLVEENSTQKPFLPSLVESLPSYTPYICVTHGEDQLGTKVRKYNLKNGEKIWDITLKSVFYVNSSCILDQKYLYFSDFVANKIVEVDIENGQQTKNFYVPNLDRLIGEGGLYVRCINNVLRAINVKDDKTTIFNILSGTRAVTIQENHLYFFREENQAKNVIGQMNVKDKKNPILGNSYSLVDFSWPEAVIVQGGWFYALYNMEEIVRGIDPKDINVGEVLRGIDVREIKVGKDSKEIAVHNGRLYVLYADGTVREFDLETGNEGRKMKVDQGSRTLTVAPYHSKNIDCMEKKLKELPTKKKFFFRCYLSTGRFLKLI